MTTAQVELRVAETDEVDAESAEALRELISADYIIFMLALDAYLRWLKGAGEAGMKAIETEGDQLLRQGVSLARYIERIHLEAIANEIRTGLTSKASLSMLEAALRQPPTIKGMSIRTLKVRTILTRNMAVVTKTIFGTSRKALQMVRKGVAAAATDDADAALSILASITLKNKRLERWIDEASALAVPLGGPVAINPVKEATASTTDDSDELLRNRVEEQAAPAATERASEASKRHDETLTRIETQARESAQKVMAKSGEEDTLVTKSEVIGIAAAAVAAAKSDPTVPSNVPSAFINNGHPLDPEQMEAALTDGRVLVAAGAGSGKSTTLVSRIAYLVQERNTKPGRILACSLNRKAAKELANKTAKKIGEDTAKQISIGTMHGLFVRFIRGDRASGVPAFGTPEEIARLSEERLIADPEEGQRSKRGPRPMNVTMAIRGIFKDCGSEKVAQYVGLGPSGADQVTKHLKAKKMNTIITAWKGNDISIAEARRLARRNVEKVALFWYECYLGLKGDIPSWHPPCSSKSQDNFMSKFRSGGQRLGDLDDQLVIFRDILRRDPKAKAMIQGMYDHIMVDEAQDRNSIQTEIFDLMAEHIGDGSDGKSLWIVGDDKQAIYQFRGAKPGLFSSLDGKEGWKTRTITTNYRCDPEIIEVANRLVANNRGQIPMTQKADPRKQSGQASIVMDSHVDNAGAAITTLARIVQETSAPPIGAGNDLSEYAVLSRTNKELDNFETAACIAEIPYARTGGRGLFDAPESKAVLSYLDLAFGTDIPQMQGSLVGGLTKPDHGLFLGADKVSEIVEDTFRDIARELGVDAKSINPMEILSKKNYATRLAQALKEPYRAKMPDFVYRKVINQLTDELLSMGDQVAAIRRQSQEGKSAMDLVNTILDEVKSTVTSWDRDRRREVVEVKSLRQQISDDLVLTSDEDDDDTPDEAAAPEAVTTDEGGMAREKKDNPAKGLGAVQFLFMLVEPNKQDADLGVDPGTASGFMKKLLRIRSNADKLRVDLKKWSAANSRLPESQRRDRPNCIVLSTVHSVKGAEWRDVTVMMESGKFPMKVRQDPNDTPPTEAEVEEQETAERNLAYVALTRAERNLTVFAVPDVKTGKLSSFVHEAGLLEGENVAKPKLEGGLPGTMSKEAAWETILRGASEGIDGEYHPDTLDESYDRRPR
jgi:superfamily I DNA/RNA helicase